MINVQRLRVLREVAARGSFSSAAAALSYTQSAVSQQIATLERETGMALVERHARGVELTEGGRALVVHADAILGRMAEAEAELEAIAGLRAGRLRLASFPSAGATLMPLAVAEFRRLHPGVELTLAQAEPEDGVAGVRAGDYDVALGIDAEFCPMPDEDVGRVALLEDPMYVALPRGHALASRARVRLGDLAEDPWLLSASSSDCPDGRILLRACLTAGFEPRIAFESDDYGAIQGFIAAGVGVALIPDLALTNVREDIVVRPLAGPAPARRIFAVALRAGSRAPAVTAMLDVLEGVGARWAAGRAELAVAG